MAVMASSGGSVVGSGGSVAGALCPVWCSDWLFTLYINFALDYPSK